MGYWPWPSSWTSGGGWGGRGLRGLARQWTGIVALHASLDIHTKKKFIKTSVLNWKTCILFYSLLDFVHLHKKLPHDYLQSQNCFKIFTSERVNLMASDEIIFHSNKRSQCYFHHRNYKSVLPPTLDMWKVLMVYVESSVTSTRRTCITPYVSAPLWGQYWSHLICNKNNSRSTLTFITTVNYLQYYNRKRLNFTSLVTRWDK